MSSTVRSYGFIAVLKTPVPKDQCDDLSERLYDECSKLDFTYDGELAYIDYNRHALRSRRENIYGLFIDGVEETGDDELVDHHDIIREADKYGLEIDPDTIRAYNCIWYNGGDSPVGRLTKASYLKKIGK